MDRPFSQACENNKEPILSVIKKHFENVESVLEIGSGTGQHAVYFAEHLPHLIWQTSDQQEYHKGIESWLQDSGLNNIRLPVTLDVNQASPVKEAPAIFSANTLHIMSWQEVEHFFQLVTEVLSQNGILCVYGPFNYNGNYSSQSNARFDQWLKDRDPLSGIRHFEDINQLAVSAGMRLLEDITMPANNRCLIFLKE